MSITEEAIMKYVKDTGGTVSGYPHAMSREWYERNGYLPYSGTLPFSRLRIEHGEVVELPEPEVPPRKFSRRSIYLELNELGLWENVEAYMESNGFLREFNYSLDISEDHPVFVTICAQLSPVLAANGADLDGLLARCILEG